MTEARTILVVDDEPVILASAFKILGSDTVRVLTAPDAEAGLRLLSEGPDIVICDLVLPGISGMRLLETALEHDPALIIILTTGYSTVENAVAALKHGAFDFLPKPFTCDELQASLARAHRAVDLRLTLNARGARPLRRGDFQLGFQTWARPEKNGTALLGVTELLLQTLPPLERVELPHLGVELRQGGELLSLVTKDGMAHRLWSPLGGRPIERNDGLADQPEILRADPAGAGWIVRVQPGDLEGELANLIGD